MVKHSVKMINRAYRLIQSSRMRMGKYAKKVIEPTVCKMNSHIDKYQSRIDRHNEGKSKMKESVQSGNMGSLKGLLTESHAFHHIHSQKIPINFQCDIMDDTGKFYETDIIVPGSVVEVKSCDTCIMGKKEQFKKISKQLDRYVRATPESMRIYMYVAGDGYESIKTIVKEVYKNCPRKIKVINDLDKVIVDDYFYYIGGYNTTRVLCDLTANQKIKELLTDAPIYIDQKVHERVHQFATFDEIIQYNTHNIVPIDPDTIDMAGNNCVLLRTGQQMNKLPIGSKIMAKKYGEYRTFHIDIG